MYSFPVLCPLFRPDCIPGSPLQPISHHSPPPLNCSNFVIVRWPPFLFQRENVVRFGSRGISDVDLHCGACGMRCLSLPARVALCVWGKGLVIFSAIWAVTPSVECPVFIPKSSPPLSSLVPLSRFSTPSCIHFFSLSLLSNKTRLPDPYSWG